MDLWQRIQYLARWLLCPYLVMVGGDQEPKGLPLGPAKNLDITSSRSFPA